MCLSGLENLKELYDMTHGKAAAPIELARGFLEAYWSTLVQIEDKEVIQSKGSQLLWKRCPAQQCRRPDKRPNCTSLSHSGRLGSGVG